MTIHSMASDENELTNVFNASRGNYNFQFKSGVAEMFLRSTQKKAGTPDARAKIFWDSVVSAPESPSVRFLQIKWEHLQGTGAFAVLLGFVCQNGRVKQVFQFSGEGSEFEVGPGDQLIINQAIWGEGDAHAGPSKAGTLYYGWDLDRQTFRRLRVDGPNPLPERC